MTDLSATRKKKYFITAIFSKNVSIFSVKRKDCKIKFNDSVDVAKFINYETNLIQL